MIVVWFPIIIEPEYDEKFGVGREGDTQGKEQV